MSKEPLRIRLGAHWSAFAYARDDMELLGTVQRGMQIGALAKLPDNTYVQVNGDILQPLNRSRIEATLRSTPAARTDRPFMSIPPSAPAPVVTVKKRRRVVVPDDLAQSR
ncbi:MAG: hypothetical protein KKC85_02765 [Gammaproteobacteria bacterium]|nr:hypothetical protein [Gammaproteobacteria bacterium]MBU1440931.1 hypothetical protein [Gammaproteobacteria bacterium]MBU2285342.1 hypothetical protein [Gammaproteobacteria bacterium]